MNQQQLFNESELPKLKSRFRWLFAYHTVLVAACILHVIFEIQETASPSALLMIISGVLGSTVAAFISILDRIANGFEDSKGAQKPPKGEKDKPRERFNLGMTWWFVSRPWLGGVVACVTYRGMLVGSSVMD